MYKLLFSIIIFSAGFSTIAEAQNVNNKATSEIYLNENSKHYTNTGTKGAVLEYKSMDEGSHNNKIVDSNSSLKIYRYPEKSAEGGSTNLNMPAHKRTIIDTNFTILKYQQIKKVQDSIKVEEQQLVKDN